MFNQLASSFAGPSQPNRVVERVKETPVPTVLYDMDAPPYFDNPVEEGIFLHYRE